MLPILLNIRSGVLEVEYRLCQREKLVGSFNIYSNDPLNGGFEYRDTGPELGKMDAGVALVVQTGNFNE